VVCFAFEIADPLVQMLDACARIHNVVLFILEEQNLLERRQECLNEVIVVLVCLQYTSEIQSMVDLVTDRLIRIFHSNF
jgi:hypothetical protein